MVMVDMPIIMGIPPHIINIGIPDDIIRVMASQRSLSMSMDMPSAGVILQVIPSFVISQDILHIIGMPMPIMPGIMPMPIMPGIMPMPIMLGIMPMPIMLGIIGIPMPMPMPIILDIIGMLIMGIIGIPMPIMLGIMPMPGIIDAPAAISGVAIIGVIVCGIMGICIAVVMGGLPVFGAGRGREPF
ncbi:hypothetical protein [Sorangium sp. So ce385]|uniref:hypothetical protein n=1 Tax=Sorangium sp. So ce385 TaxID=3133308 RepID=UPI003F5C94E6